jgi:simple sugar transport system ATP-binding protein
VSNDEYIVEMRHITKRFSDIAANDDISVGIKKGEIFAFLGENGAGKSTLMNVLFGMYEPDEGEIFVRGQKVDMSSSNAAAALNIGMVHQHFKLAPHYTIAENIILGAEPVKKALGLFPFVAIREAGRQIRALSKTYGLEVDPDLRIEQVNVSTQQRVEILKMLYREADILIFDEPTAVLTPREIEFLLDIMRELRNKGKTIILITHKLEEIKRIADRCAILRRGKLIRVLKAEDASAQEMADLMVGREVSLFQEKSPAQFGEVVLDVQELTVRNADRFEVVKDISFTIRAGEIFAIAGVAGNGQLELADAAAGLVKPYKGKIWLNGRDITGESIRGRTEAGIAYIPEDRQKYGLILDFTLADNLAVKQYYRLPFSKNAVLNQESFRQFAEQLIDRYDIRGGQNGKAVIRSMSGGNQQKAIIAREISLDSHLLIFVQPTRGLDIGAIERVRNQILAERDKGKAVLLISLELDEVMNLADTIGVIFNGRLLNISPASLLTAHEVGEYMMGVMPS